MASSYFTRPFGLRPTPAICFPPPPPPGGGTVTGILRVIPNQFQSGSLCEIRCEPKNSNLPVGDPVAAEWTMPCLIGIPSTNEENFIDSTVLMNFVGVPGLYTGKVRLTWSNGQIRTIQCFYQILP